MDPRSPTTIVTRLLSVLAIFFVTSPVLAQDQTQDQNQVQGNPWYQVEVVVFKHTDAADTEVWPDDPGAPDISHVAELSPTSASPVIDQEASTLFAGSDQDQAFIAFLTGDYTQTNSTPMAFRLLPDNEDQLANVITRLNNAGDYQVLYHAAWRQPAYDPDKSIPVHVHYDPLGVQTRMLSTVDEELARQSMDQTQGDGAAAPAPAPAPPPEQMPPAMNSEDSTGQPAPSWLLNGVIGLTQSRYLHMDVDLVYQVNTPVDQSQQESIIGDTVMTQTYRLQQSRRIRSDKLFYFDHPRFGVLARITPFTPPSPPAPAQGNDAGQVTGKQVPNQ